MLKKIIYSFAIVTFSLFNEGFCQVKYSSKLLPEKKQISTNTAEEEKKIYLGNDGYFIYKRTLDSMLNLRLNDFASFIKELIRVKHVPNGNKIKDDIIKSFGMAIFDNDDNVTVEVMNKSEAKSHTAPIRQYYIKVFLLNYTEVNISYSDIKFTSPLHKGEDGTYGGTVEVLQHFAGYKDGELAYNENTFRKTFNYKILLDGSGGVGDDGGLKFNLFLSNIYVTEFYNK